MLWWAYCTCTCICVNDKSLCYIINHWQLMTCGTVLFDCSTNFYFVLHVNITVEKRKGYDKLTIEYVNYNENDNYYVVMTDCNIEMT